VTSPRPGGTNGAYARDRTLAHRDAPALLDEVWLCGLRPEPRDAIAAALEDWGVTPVPLRTDTVAWRLARGTPAALVLDVPRLAPEPFPRALATHPAACRVPVVALDDGLGSLDRLAELRPFQHVLVLPSGDASAVVGALDWLLGAPGTGAPSPSGPSLRKPSAT